MWGPSWCIAHDLNISSTTEDRVCGVPPGVQRMTLIVISTTEDRVCGVPPGVQRMTLILAQPQRIECVESLLVYST